MSALPKGRRAKAATLIPLALISAAWTASLTGADASPTAAATTLPDGTTVPTQAIEAPASVPLPGAISAAVPEATASDVVAGASAAGIPAAAISAYQRGSQIINAADSACRAPWELLAAIGRVESNHGQYGGNTLDANGVSQPGIYGPQLNGQNGTQAIADTDGGQLDQDPVYDRAVGPMQFIPSTWSSVKVDADGDGERNPQDIDDATLAAAVYLCSGDEDLSSRAGQEAAVFRYNHSNDYVDLVLRIMEAYSQGEYTAIPSGTYGGTLFTPDYTPALKSRQPKPTKTQPAKPTAQPSAPSSPKPAAPAPAVPAPSKATDPITKATEGITKTLTSVTTAVTEPVEKTLNTLAASLDFCNTQFATIKDPLGLLKPAQKKCATRIQGMTEEQALGAIPNTLLAILSWLGL